MADTFTATDLDTAHLVNEFNAIRRILNKTLGKMAKDDMLALFMNNETFSEKSRLLVSGVVDSAFRGYGMNEYQFTYGVTWQIDALVLNAQRGRYKD